MTMEFDVNTELVSASSIEDTCSNPVDMIDRLPVLPVPMSSLGPGLFLRQSGTDAAHVQLLADAASSGELPAILVQKSSLRVVDGMHRIEAAKLRGKRSINARFVDCSDQDAFMLAVKSNTQHGLPLTRADRIAGAKRILDWHADWSDRAVAAAAGLSAKTVAGLRYRSGGEVQDPDKRLGRDGKRRPVTGIEGRKRAAEYLIARPDASLREVARETDVSLGTVHDVRSKLRRGVDPTVVGQPRSSQEEPVISSATNASRDWSSISFKLAKDPSIKYTESGRVFLRWMTSRMIQPGEWREFVNAVPAHWTEDISLVAEGVGDAWREFAGQLRARQSRAV